MNEGVNGGKSDSLGSQERPGYERPFGVRGARVEIAVGSSSFRTEVSPSLNQETCSGSSELQPRFLLPVSHFGQLQAIPHPRLIQRLPL